ncbi:TetR/AcrR family transcriptional regulator [Lichenibacterium ramalinae]|uniref:TetR/AcrR family transcriptional regulator n=1 Tax=Lichenibacterium ramalinae TaxID=2316527 RepID=A0A4Q2RB72_9HYPH|nr:TetR/AcrR family transcriptional regulator [Lichenibacterium ramalinae]RYB03259.1 TetR/AcrR family transcriptional regulator [Lichenibacterium ramalinae]
MPMEMRSQGRPARGDGEVGRIRLLERTREALKAKPKIDLQRREIALAAGVTPALVSYYYPDKWDLLAAAAKPVIESYTAEVRAILGDEGSPHRKVLALTYLFIDFNFQHGYLLDFYLENSARMARQDDMRHLQEVYGEMMAFFDGLLRDGLMRGDSPAFIQASLWGLCKYVAQQPSLAGLGDAPERDAVLRAQAAKVCDLFLNGAATGSMAEMGGVDHRAPVLSALA